MGSQLITDLAWEDLQPRLEPLRKRLGLTRADAHQQFTEEFEAAKRVFPNKRGGYVIPFEDMTRKRRAKPEQIVITE